jgi:CotS family spore coat protein
LDDLSIKVLRAYDIKNAGIIKEKGAYRVRLASGDFLIRKTNQAAKKIQFQHEVKENLYLAGFQNIDRFHFSTQNKPYVQLDDDIYTMTDYINYPEACFSNNADFMRILESTAKMHALLRRKNFEYASDSDFFCEDISIPEYEKSLQRIKKIKSGLNIEKRLSDIDVMFLKNYDYYTNRIAQSISKLKSSKFEDYVKKSISGGYVRHNNLKEENIFVNGANVYITNFSEISVGYYLFDLENIIRRYMKNLPKDCVPIKEAINEYNKYNELSEDETEILAALLLYPQKFIKVSAQYYSKKHAFIPGSIYSRMKAEIDNREIYGKYLEEFTS